MTRAREILPGPESIIVGYTLPWYPKQKRERANAYREEWHSQGASHQRRRGAAPSQELCSRAHLADDSTRRSCSDDHRLIPHGHGVQGVYDVDDQINHEQVVSVGQETGASDRDLRPIPPSAWWSTATARCSLEVSGGVRKLE